MVHPEAMPGRIYTKLLELAQERHGYLTPEDVRAAGIDPLRLQDLVRRDLAEHVARGVYRIPLVPPTALDQYMEATLWPQGAQAVLCHETALELHELCDVNPAKIHVTVPERYRVRRAVPPLYVLHHRDLDDRDVTWHEGIPIVTPYRAILDGIEANLGARLIEQAVDTATRRGLLRRDQRVDLQRRLPEPAPA
jgi:predicted transcriptional regulator of viral defense system